MTETEALDEIVEKFLQAAVLIDDEVAVGGEVGPELPGAERAEEAEIKDPSEFAHAEDETGASSAAHKPLDGETLVKHFSDCGLICSTYKWRADADTFPKSTDKADLIILDWKLSEQEAAGETALAFLSERLQTDLNNDRRLRYITIYTDKKSDDVLEAVGARLELLDGVTLELTDDAIEVSVEGGAKIWRILYVSKRATDETELVGHILDDFKTFTAGLLPRLVMAAVAEIRNRTFEYLYRYGAHLDEAAISHHLLLRSSELAFPSATEDFRDYMVNLIVSDMSDSIHGSDLVVQAASPAAIEARLDGLKDVSAGLMGEPDKSTADLTKIKALVGAPTREEFLGAAKAIITKEKALEKLGSSVDKGVVLLSSSEGSFQELAMRDLYNEHPRQIGEEYQLRSGTIVRVEDTNGGHRYLICVQPLCDGVRLEGECAFPFVGLSIVENENMKFTYVIRDPEFVYLKCGFKPADIVMARFEANPDTRDVRTKTNAEDLIPVFIDVSGNGFRWVAELKEIYALELQSGLATSGARIPSNKFEWLRGRNS